MVGLALTKPGEASADLRWIYCETFLGELNTSVLHYDRDGCFFNTPSLQWAVDVLRNGCELLIDRPHLTPANLRATPQIRAHLALAEGPLRRSARFPKDRLLSEFNALSVALYVHFLAWLATPGRCAAQGGKGAPRSLAELDMRLDYTTTDRLFTVLPRLAGAFKAARPPLERARDLRQLIDILTRCGALQRGRLDEWQTGLLLEGLSESFARAERETGAMATFKWIMHHLKSAYTQLTDVMILPENANDPDFLTAKGHWFVTGEYMPLSRA